MNAKNILGFKLFKEDESGVHMIRIIKVKESEKTEFSTLTIKDYDNGEEYKIKYNELKGYTPLEPDAVMTVSVATTKDSVGNDIKDVIVTASKYINIKAKLKPFVVCRQCIVDVFNIMLSQDEEKTIYGMSMNQEDTPAGFDFNIMLAADSIDYHTFINFYRTDTLEDLIKLIPLFRFNSVLRSLYEEYCKANNDPYWSMKHEKDGWCDNIELLLKINNFQTDLDQMLGITELDFDISEYINYKPIPGNESEEYGYLRDDIRYWLSSIYNVNIKEANIIEYDHDINLADYNNTTYLLFRDSTNKVYLVVYTVDGEFLKSDLEAKEQEYDFSSKFRLKFYNKYNNDNNSQD